MRTDDLIQFDVPFSQTVRGDWNEKNVCDTATSNWFMCARLTTSSINPVRINMLFLRICQYLAYHKSGTYLMSTSSFSRSRDSLQSCNYTQRVRTHTCMRFPFLCINAIVRAQSFPSIMVNVYVRLVRSKNSKR